MGLSVSRPRLDRAQKPWTAKIHLVQARASESSHCSQSIRRPSTEKSRSRRGEILRTNELPSEHFWPCLLSLFKQKQHRGRRRRGFACRQNNSFQADFRDTFNMNGNGSVSAAGR